MNAVTVSDQILQSEAVLVDMDGCLIASGAALPGATELIELAGERLVLVSNNSSHSARQLSEWLATIGLKVPASRIVLAGELALQRAREQYADQPIMLLASDALREYAQERGIQLCDRQPACIVLTRDLNLTYERIATAMKHLGSGVPLIVANPDLTHPDKDGLPVPETGALLSLFEQALPGLQYEVMGKPEPAMFEAGMALRGASPQSCVMIGDNPATDIAGADRLGIPALQVGFGEQSRARTLAGLLKLNVSA